MLISNPIAHHPQLVAGIGQMHVSCDPSMMLLASNLGSCLGIAVFDPMKKCGGMVHCLLPFSGKDVEKANRAPCMYVDTGLMSLIKALMEKGAEKRRLVIAVAGGAQINDENSVFQIGKKNYTILRKILWKNNLLIKAEDVGGEQSRTIALHVGTGDVMVRSCGQWRVLV